MADQEKPKSNIKRSSKSDKYLPDEKVGEYEKFLRERESGEKDFGSAGEEAIKNVKPESIKNALMKKMFMAMSDSGEQSNDSSCQDVNIKSIDDNVIRLLSNLNKSSATSNTQDVATGDNKKNKSKSKPQEVKLVNIDNYLFRKLSKLNQVSKKTDRREKLPGFSVENFSNYALKQLGSSIVGKVRGKAKVEDEDKDKNKDGFLIKLIKTAVPLLVTAGAYVASIQKMFQGDALQGIANIVSKGFALLFVNLGSALPKLFASGGFMRTILGGIFGKTAATTVAKAGSKGLLSGLLKGVSQKFLSKLPIIGSLISIGSALLRLSRGDILGGLIDVGAAVAYLFPGVGTGIGIALDLINARRDIKSGGTGPGIIAKTVTSFKNWFFDNARNLPIVGTAIRLGETIGYFSTGDFKTGFKSLFGTFASVIPFGGGVYDWLFGSTDPEASDDGKSGVLSSLVKNAIDFLIGSIWEKLTGLFGAVFDKAKNVIGGIKNKFTIPDWKENEKAADAQEQKTTSVAEELLKTGKYQTGAKAGEDINQNTINTAFKVLEKQGVDTSRYKDAEGNYKKPEKSAEEKNLSKWSNIALDQLKSGIDVQKDIMRKTMNDDGSTTLEMFSSQRGISELDSDLKNAIIYGLARTDSSLSVNMARKKLDLFYNAYAAGQMSEKDFHKFITRALARAKQKGKLRASTKPEDSSSQESGGKVYESIESEDFDVEKAPSITPFVEESVKKMSGDKLKVADSDTQGKLTKYKKFLSDGGTHQHLDAEEYVAPLLADALGDEFSYNPDAIAGDEGSYDDLLQWAEMDQGVDIHDEHELDNFILSKLDNPKKPNVEGLNKLSTPKGSNGTLNSEIKSMIGGVDPQNQVLLTKEQGTPKIDESYKKLADTLDANTEQLKNVQNQQSNVVTNANTTSNSTNIFQHAPKSIQRDRSKQRDIGYNMSFAY